MSIKTSIQLFLILTLFIFSLITYINADDNYDNTNIYNYDDIISCKSNSECFDGIWCNGDETCSSSSSSQSKKIGICEKSLYPPPCKKMIEEANNITQYLQSNKNSNGRIIVMCHEKTRQCISLFLCETDRDCEIFLSLNNDYNEYKDELSSSSSLHTTENYYYQCNKTTFICERNTQFLISNKYIKTMTHVQSFSIDDNINDEDYDNVIHKKDTAEWNPVIAPFTAAVIIVAFMALFGIYIAYTIRYYKTRPYKNVIQDEDD